METITRAVRVQRGLRRNINHIACGCVPSHTVVFASLRPHGWQPARLLCPWDFPGRNTGVGYHFILQGGLPNARDQTEDFHIGRQILFPLNHLGSPTSMREVAFSTVIEMEELKLKESVLASLSSTEKRVSVELGHRHEKVHSLWHSRFLILYL